MLEELDGIVRKDGYTFWHNVSIVDKYIFDYITNIFPNGLVIPEFCLIDWFVLEKDLPIEIQSTILKPTGTPAHAGFEKAIRQPIEQNINIYGNCWFFFDSEYLRYLKNCIEGNISINYDWFYRFMKEDKLKVFTCSFDGKIEEKCTKDFEFIKNFSSTCEIEENQDFRIIQRNKSKIMYNILKNLDTKSEDIVRLRNKILFSKYGKQERGTFWQITKYTEDSIEKTICNTYRMLGGELDIINRALDCNIDADSFSRDERMVPWYLDVLGLTEIVWRKNSKKVLRRFVDKNNIGQYLPGFMRNKEKWNYLKDNKLNLTKRQLDAIIRGKINPLDWRKLINAGW